MARVLTMPSAPGLASNRLGEPLGRLIDRVTGDWRAVLESWRVSDAGGSLIRHVDAQVQAGVTVYPRDVFRALAMTPLPQTRVVILGQDPYHTEGLAEGLAFSVPVGRSIPPSLRNIRKELQRDLGAKLPEHGHLGGWAQTGVLLLNTSLTVEEGSPASHAKQGWEPLTDDLVRVAAAHPAPKVFMLWGAHAQAKLPLIEGASDAHLVLSCNHPSPLAAARLPKPFVGCGHFSAALSFLSSQTTPSRANHLPDFALKSALQA